MSGSRLVDAGGRRDGAAGWPRRFAATLWGDLPLLLALDLILVVAAIPPLLVIAAGAVPLAPILAAFTLGPVWAAATAALGRILDGDAVPARAIPGLIRRHARSGVAVAIVPAAALTAGLGTLAILAAHPGQRWLLVPLFVDGSVAVLALLGAVTAVPLANEPGRRGRALWGAALGRVAATPVPVVGVAAVVVRAWVGGRVVGPVAPVVLLAPIAALAVAVTRGDWREVAS